MDKQVLETVSAYAQPEGFTIRLTCGELEPKLYRKISDLFEKFGGKWKGGKERAHIFPDGVAGNSVIESILAGELPPKNPYALFPTPLPIIDLLMDETCATHPDRDAPLRFLEPSAGTGAIATRLRADYPNATIDCVEIDPLNVRILNGLGLTVIHDDFMTFTAPVSYDAVVMNPPFQGDTYIDHIRKALEMTDEGGVLAAIVLGGKFETWWQANREEVTAKLYQQQYKK